MIRLAVYGDIDLNLVDGSAVWLASLVETLSGADSQVCLFLKAPPRRRVLSGPLEELPRVTVHPPQEGKPHTSPARALDQIEALDRARPFDAIILRGFHLAQEAAGRAQIRGRLWTYVTDIPQSREAMDPRTAAALGEIAEASMFVLCQTEELRCFLEGLVPQVCRKTALLPPMIPAPRVEPRPLHRASLRRMVYAGKFAPAWATLEMVRLFKEHRRQDPDLELHVFGDKIHNPKGSPSFASRMRSALETTQGLRWHRATPRQALLDRLPQMDVAWAWRLPQINESLELSTKLLEYGAAGVPAILCRNEIHEQLLGGGYPLFADSLDEVAGLLRHLAQEPALIAEAAQSLRSSCQEHLFGEVLQRQLRPLLLRLQGGAPGNAGGQLPRATPGGAGHLAPARDAPAGRPRTVLVAGHDLKFISAIMDNLGRMGHHLLVDRWKGHDDHDEAQSRELLERADTVLCEWCLGNAVWYSQVLAPHQRLVIRFHAQELRGGYPARVLTDNVSRIIFVGAHMRDQAVAKLGWPRDKLCVIPNGVDPVDLARPKLRGSRFNLGMLGICPAQKGFDRALDLLEELRAREPSFTLFVKSQMPWDLGWLWKRAEERAYFERAFERVRRSPLLTHSVVFDPPGPDVGAWLRKIGFVLSLSEHESFHLAVAEGATSGALPAVLGWPGASQIYPTDWISPDLPSVMERIRHLAGGRPLATDEETTSLSVLRSEASRYAVERFHRDWVAAAIAELL